jgi:hypothetical protein
MMYESLYQYFLQFKQLPVPGIGTFLLERKPAVVNFPDKRMDPPAYAVSLEASGVAPSRSFFSWLGVALQVSERDAVIRYNDFAFELKKSILSGARVNWKGMGQLSKGLAGDIRFIPVQSLQPEAPVRAEKPIREKAAHKVRVGEDERTSEEMTAFFSKPEEKKNYWWAWALMLGLIAVMYIGWYISTNGVGLAATSNPGQLPLQEAGSTYRILP